MSDLCLVSANFQTMQLFVGKTFPTMYTFVHLKSREKYFGLLGIGPDFAVLVGSVFKIRRYNLQFSSIMRKCSLPLYFPGKNGQQSVFEIWMEAYFVVK